MNRKVTFLVGLSVLFATSCREKFSFDENAQNNGNNEEKAEANTFDFSTSQEISLNVDYSAFETYGPVFFSVYNEYPFEGSGESISMKEGLSPVFEAYTDENGKFSQTIELPSYAKELYVFTGNFFIADNIMTATVKDGAATAVAISEAEANARSNRFTFTRGVPTTSLETLYQLTHEVDVYTGDKTDKRVYKDWVTPLGTWDSESGRPDYLLDKATADPKLFFTDDEIWNINQTVANVLIANQPCPKTYRNQADLTLKEDSEVSITFIGGITCWNNSMGYYYYQEGNEPTKCEDLNIIMLFPNTQDGKWYRSWMRHPNFYGNIALDRGDVVQLKYYPNIANGDLSGETTTFPAGTRIGFILKSNAWGMQKPVGDKKYYNSYRGEGVYKQNKSNIARQYNVWGSSTNGLSYCTTDQVESDNGAIAKPNLTGEARTALFAYKNEQGQEYAIVSFEDACNDLDFDDVIFAMKPVSAFKPLPTVERKISETSSVYAYEDLWPAKGDYDMNDALVEVKQEKIYTKLTTEKDFKVHTQSFKLTTYQNYVELVSGLGVTLETKQNPTSVTMKKVLKASNDTVEASFKQEGKVYLLTDDIKSEVNSTYILELVYANGISDENKLAKVKPFIYRTEEGNLRKEVHVPYEAPTAKMNTKYFGTQDDLSVPAEGKYYVRAGNYPFAFCLTGVTIDSFKNTLLKSTNERKKISDIYPDFLDWAVSNGTEKCDWYLNPAK